MKRTRKGCIKVTAANAASLLTALDMKRVRACERSAQLMRDIQDPGGAAFFERLAHLPAGILRYDEDDGDGGLPKDSAPKPVRPSTLV